jgi:hypothetical protein
MCNFTCERQASDAPRSGKDDNDGFAFYDRASLGDTQATACKVLERSVFPLVDTTILAETRTRVREVTVIVVVWRAGTV